MSFTKQFLAEVQQVTAQLNEAAIEKCADELAAIRERGGRLFILGVGGSAGNAGHAVNDFRKICGFEAYAPTDNVSELTARTNDEGWATIFAEWLKGSRINAKDGLLIFSVGGGNLEKNVSPNLVNAIQLAKQVGASVIGIVGRDGGYTAKEATACVIVPTVNPDARHAAQRGVSGASSGICSCRIPNSKSRRPNGKPRSEHCGRAPFFSTATASSTALWSARPTVSADEPGRI